MNILIIIPAILTVITLIFLFISWKREFDRESKELWKNYYEIERSEMAAVDKIYGTKEQYDEFWLWCGKNLPKAHRYFYEWYDEWNDGLTHPMTNFPEEIDRLLYFNCPLPYVKETLAQQYDKGYFERRDAELNES